MKIRLIFLCFCVVTIEGCSEPAPLQAPTHAQEVREQLRAQDEAESQAMLDSLSVKNEE